MTDITIYVFKFISSFTNFQISRLKKFNELFEKKMFEIINIEDLFAETRIFNNRFINQIKNEETEKTFEKSRLIM